ncbi:hypothetical protein T12_762, partial [Trichinella patagoniensis]
MGRDRISIWVHICSASKLSSVRRSSNGGLG